MNKNVKIRRAKRFLVLFLQQAEIKNFKKWIKKKDNKNGAPQQTFLILSGL